MRTGGLFDLQVNGYAGVDFNDPGITADRLDHALDAMSRDGVTGCLPTLITAKPEHLRDRFAALDNAVRDSRLGESMVPGYHLEGPFLNASAGYCGCHPADAMSEPDTTLIANLERTLLRPILLMTVAPERTGMSDAIHHWVAEGKTIAIAHSAADFATVDVACDAGLTMSTHLGNGLPQSIPKLDNTLLAQLGEPRLAACLIADGIHIPRAALAALVRLKGVENCILVTDAVLAAAMPPDTYRFAGMDVRLLDDGRVVQPSGTGLAGSALRLDQGVRNVVDWGIADPRSAVALAGSAPRAALARSLTHHGITMDPGQIDWNDAMQPTLARKPVLSFA